MDQEQEGVKQHIERKSQDRGRDLRNQARPCGSVGKSDVSSGLLMPKLARSHFSHSLCKGASHSPAMLKFSASTDLIRVFKAGIPASGSPHSPIPPPATHTRPGASTRSPHVTRASQSKFAPKSLSATIMPGVDASSFPAKVRAPIGEGLGRREGLWGVVSSLRHERPSRGDAAGSGVPLPGPG